MVRLSLLSWWEVSLGVWRQVSLQGPLKLQSVGPQNSPSFQCEALSVLPLPDSFTLVTMSLFMIHWHFHQSKQEASIVIPGLSTWANHQRRSKTINIHANSNDQWWLIEAFFFYLKEEYYFVPLKNCPYGRYMSKLYTESCGDTCMLFSPFFEKDFFLM